MKCAVFSCKGLGDAMLTLTLSHNLQINGHEVITFHPFMAQLQQWFPDLPLSPFPQVEELIDFDRLFILYEKTPWMEEIIAHADPKKTTILSPIATHRHDYQYWDQGKFDGRKHFIDNLCTFCKETLHLPRVQRHNGIFVPPELKRDLTRVIIHPTSSRPSKNWPKERFFSLAAELVKLGYTPAFVIGSEERVGWEEVDAPHFATLNEMAHFIAGSGWMIGNDSGVGHLASALGVPTVTIGCNPRRTRFWRPNWAEGVVVHPPRLVPNIRTLRLRDRYWKQLITVKRVLRAFHQLRKSGDKGSDPICLREKDIVGHPE